jgi:hypothetical protein
MSASPFPLPLFLPNPFVYSPSDLYVDKNSSAIDVAPYSTPRGTEDNRKASLAKFEANPLWTSGELPSVLKVNSKVSFTIQVLYFLKPSEILALSKVCKSLRVAAFHLRRREVTELKMQPGSAWNLRGLSVLLGSPEAAAAHVNRAEVLCRPHFDDQTHWDTADRVESEEFVSFMGKNKTDTTMWSELFRRHGASEYFKLGAHSEGFSAFSYIQTPAQISQFIADTENRIEPGTPGLHHLLQVANTALHQGDALCWFHCAW